MTSEKGVGGSGGWRDKAGRGKPLTLNSTAHFGIFQISYHANEFLYSKQIRVQNVKFCDDSTMPLQISTDSEGRGIFHSVAAVLIRNLLSFLDTNHI